ncbi:hypothetical protein BJ912DRAFT_870046 [Pholiota molesta]|nr:hypothetical protein BJ912DRAFT_870046 [Pholiota molesta]
MTDRDLAQINACCACYPESTILLCWWHVLHSWQQHLVISKNEDLWKNLQQLVRIQDPRAFDIALQEIEFLAPHEFMEYFNAYWLCEPFLSMWSGVCRKNLGIYEISNTNMLIEA